MKIQIDDVIIFVKKNIFYLLIIVVLSVLSFINFPKQLDLINQNNNEIEKLNNDIKFKTRQLDEIELFSDQHLDSKKVIVDYFLPITEDYFTIYTAIDSITAYTLLFKDDYQRRESIVSFIERLHDWKTTSMIISEMPPTVSETREGSIGFLSDAIIALHYLKPDKESGREHSVEVLKMRGTNHSTRVFPLSFESKGLRVRSEALSKD